MAEQLELLNGDEFHDYKLAAQRTLSEIATPSEAVPEYSRVKEEWEPNPIYTERAGDHYNDAPMTYFGEPEETFLPSYEIESPQDVISPPSVDHMTKHATGLDVPNISAYQFGDTTMVMDGNHRVNAALNRGQMLIPATLRKAE